tara:strand:+ start:124 stop:621 length:498 start_codon:yes stop_codon:yes gene_type:complete
MSEIRCPECQCLLKDKDLKNDKCWKCGLTPIMERIREEQKFYLEKEEQKKQERLDEKEKKRQEKEQKRQEKEQILKNITLSEKYDVLKIYKGLAFLLMIAVTGFYIYSLVQFSDLPKEMRKMLENGMITTTVSYFISMFSLFCLTKIIDFLFDLDNQDKISSEKE